MVPPKRDSWPAEVKVYRRWSLGVVAWTTAILLFLTVGGLLIYVVFRVVG